MCGHCVGPMCTHRHALAGAWPAGWLPSPSGAPGGRPWPRPCSPPSQVGKMRTALKAVWPRLLWTTLYDREHVRERGGCLSHW